MRTRPLKNVSASVRDRLLARSRQTGVDFQSLLWRYVKEIMALVPGMAGR